MNCPCCSGHSLADCCARLISQRERPENAVALMRSRYTAFALGKMDYLLESWHPRTCPKELELDPGLRWVGLEILGSGEQGDEAWVEFEARMIIAGREEALRERSRFLQVDGRWKYVDGALRQPRFQPRKPGRNEPCPCGSGNKFKRCCGSR